MALLRLTPRLLRAACALAGWSLDELARRAGQDKAPLVAFDAGSEDAHLPPPVEQGVVESLGKAGVTFVEADVQGAGVRWLHPPEGEGTSMAVPVEELNASNDE